MAVEDDDIEDIYELSPAQRGMLFHTLYAPHSGVYMEQAIYSIQGSLHLDALRTAWQYVVTQHSTLRTAFLWEDLDEPVQVVYQHVQVPWEYHDWRENAPEMQQIQLEELVTADRLLGFDLAQPPLLRLSLLHVATDTYVFILTHHHLLLDGWSLAIVLQEFLDAYRRLCSNQTPHFKTRRSYRDYIVWLRQQNLAGAEAFWRQYLQGFVAPTTLLLNRLSGPETVETPGESGIRAEASVPGDKERLELRLRGGRPVELQGLTLSAEKTAQLRAFARRHQLTLNTLLQGAWALLLNRYGGETDVVFGAIVAGRPIELAGAEAMVGLFINTLPVRVQMSPQMHLLPWLIQLQTQQAEARQYDYSPLVQVHGWSEVLRDQPLFESLLVFENYYMEEFQPEGDEEQSDDLRIRELQYLEQTNYPLVVIVEPGAALKIQFGYEIARFAPGAIRCALTMLGRMLEGFIANPQARLADLSLVNETERRQLLTRWNTAEASYSPDGTLSQMFQERALITPEAIALVSQVGDQSQHLTYAELDHRANQLAQYLQRAGVGPEVRVGLYMERSFHLLIGLLAILKAGGAYVPLDPAYPQERLAFLLADAQAAVLITQQKFLARITATTERIICIDEERTAIEQEAGDPPLLRVYPGNAACVIYTSGSTGTPKGVVVTHQSLLNHCIATGQRYALETTDRVLQFASIGFDVALEELFPSWLCGATVVQWQGSVAPALTELSRLAITERLTVLNLPSSYWHEWVSELSRPQAPRPTDLRLMIVGSERVSATHFMTWRNLMGQHVSWRNAYGLTETTVTALIYEPERSVLDEQLTSIPIGRPLANVQAYVLDTQLQPLPAGMPGELYIAGACLARGYLCRPDLTAERFIPHPFSSLPGARLYRTGDLVRYREDGNLEFLGRTDTQIKLRGYRIEPGEIETLLSQHSSISDAVVLAREEAPNEIQLVAYIVPVRIYGERGFVAASPTSSQLRQYLQNKLPPYMVPGAFIFLDALPRSPSGKVNPHALPAFERALTNADEEYIAPRTPIEEILAGIWAAVLRLERVSRVDSFFKLGGHSLQATQVVARLREVLHIELPVRAIYDAPTILTLASFIEKVRQNAKGQTIPPIQRADRSAELPLSFAQQRLWFLDQLQPGSPLYNIPGSFYIQGRLDVAALQNSINDLALRHEPLRTTFAVYAEQPVQIIAPTLCFSLPVIDLSNITDKQIRQAEIVRLARAEALRPFNLQQGPLVHVTLLRLPSGEHILLLTLHHIVADGWSADIFFHDLRVYYAARTADESVSLPDLSIQYVDYAVWQREWLQGDLLERQLAYWRNQLAGTPGMLELPTDRPRPVVQTFQGAQDFFTLTPSLTAQLKTLSQQEDVTLFMMLLAAFQTLLARYTGQTDIVVGSPIAGRTHLEVEHIIGFFVNTLVLRTDLSGNPTFREVLTRVREMSLAAYTHQDLPFEKLVEELQPERSLSQSPLFQVLFVLQNASSGNANHRLPDHYLNLEPLEIGSRTAKFDLSFELIETSEGLAGYIEFNTDLFEAPTIRRMVGHYITLLASIVIDLDQPIATLPLLTVAENHQILKEWNNTRQISSQKECLHSLFEAQASRAPDRVAIVFEDQQVTYGELNARANQLAHYLQHLGISSESLVGLCFERSPEMIVGVLGILKAGGAYVPLDPDYPFQRLAFLVTDTQMPVLLTQERLRARLPEHDVHTLCLDTAWKEIATWPTVQPQYAVMPDNLAYIIYTSGSTGIPKGVAMPHAPLVNLFTWQHRNSALASDARTLQFASLSFDVASQEIFCTLGFGHTLVLLSEELRRDPGEMLTKIVNEAIERLFLPVVALQQLADAVGEIRSVPSTLREVITAGEQLQITPPLVALFAKLPETLLYNHYGPSESHVVSSYLLPDAPHTWPALPAIGRPLDNVNLYVLDRHMQPVPVGVPGELHIGGKGLARGYLARPNLTAASFVPHPWSDEPGARLYKTGDLACFLPDGNLQFLGRNGHQVKIRGYRIELGEIEATLSRYPGVQEVVVLAREDNPGEKRLVAYVVKSQASITPGSAELRQYLQTCLPGYMVPAHVVLLAELPLTSNGKIDRRALPAPDSTEYALGDASTLPKTLVEAVLLAIWANILHLEQVRTQDNFFEQGGHSLLATQMIARTREAFHTNIPLRAVFESPILADLAARIEMERDSPFKTAEIPPLVPSPQKMIIPLSYAQERLWFLDQLEPENLAYNLPVPLHIEGEFHTEALEESLHALIERHEVLRTTFIVEGGIPRQIIAPLLHINLKTVDLSYSGAETQLQEVQEQATKEVSLPFDLSQGPLLRALILRLSEHEHVILLTIHHSIADGWSTSILVDELNLFYGAALAGTTSSLSPLPIQYADYAIWQRQWLHGEVMEQQMSYWREQLMHAPAVLNLPTDFPRPVVQRYRGDACFFAFPVPLSHELQALSQREAATIFMTLLAAFQTLLFRYCGQTDIVVGTPIAGRTRSETEGLIGLFINTLALRTDLSGDPSFRTLLGRVREVCLEAYAHQDVPFGKIVEAVQPERSLSHHPLFQVMFILQNAPIGVQFIAPGDEENRLLHPYPLTLGNPTTKFDLTVELVESPAGLHGTVEYNTDLFERETIERLISHYQLLLAGVVASPEQKLSSLPLLDRDELRLLLLDWNATATGNVPASCIHQIFEEQVVRSPDAIAIIDADQQFTYRELNQRANRLARVLQAKGVGPEVVIGLYMRRSLEMIVGLLGILKAGGAYLPLDSNLPGERLSFMLEETQAPILLTQRHMFHHLSPYQGQVICLDRDEGLLEDGDATNLAGTVTAANLAYVIYTSGSTGRPKGVMTTHSGLVNYLHWSIQTYVAEQGQGSLLHSSLVSDLTVTSVFTPLLVGQHLVLLTEEQGIDALGNALRSQQNLSLVKLTPAHLTLLAEQLAGENVNACAHAFILGGEALQHEHLTFWQERAPEMRLINEYGPTETVVGCCVYELPPGKLWSHTGSVPIGRPINNTQLYLLDAALHPVPIGVHGELYIAGAGVARGYLQRPELTAERFLPNPFSEEAGARFYRTGDIARYLPDGNLEFLGRNDSQLKVRGYRIEPGEIEAALTGYPGVQEAIILLEKEGSTLVAYLTAQPDASPTSAELRAFLRERLPDYMIPAFYVLLDALPLLPNGKVDRNALSVIGRSRRDSEIEKGGGEPRNSVEATLVSIWSQVLGQEQVSIYDNFFDLGGHSLLSTQVISRVRESLQIELPLRTLFEKPTIADFAEAVIQKEFEQTDSDELMHMLMELEGTSPDEVSTISFNQREVSREGL
jgi:amino acid adenylation domain-containing protein